MMITWVRLVGVILMTDCLVADNPCDALGRTDLLHIDGHCFHISPADAKMDFDDAKHACPSIIRRGRMAVPHSPEIRSYLFSVANERELRWVGMQPISNWIERNSVKWVDNTAAKDVFDTSNRHGIAKPTREEPFCMAFGNGESLVMNCKESIGYICESELRVPLSATDPPPTTLRRPSGEDWPSPSFSRLTTGASLSNGRDISKDAPPTKPTRPSGEDGLSSSVSRINSTATTSTGRENSKGIPLWLVITICAVTVCLVVGITVLICVCWRRRRRRGSNEDKRKEMFTNATKCESTHHESREMQYPMLATEEQTYKGHLYEIPRLRDPIQSDNTQGSHYSHEAMDERECSPNSHLKHTQGHGKGKSDVTCDVYAEVNLEEKHKTRLDASGAQNDMSDDEYSTALVENTIYGQ